MTYRAVIFDLFGTLVPTFARSPHDDVLEAMAKILRVPRTEFMNLWVDSYDDRATGRMSIEAQIATISAQLGRVATNDQIARCMRLRLALTRGSLIPRPDAIATLRAIRSRERGIGLVSDCSPEPSVLWPETALAPLIDVALFSCVEGTCKPDPRLYITACERLHVEPPQCLYVGDGGSRELTGAASVGMHALQLRAFEHEDEPVGYDDAREPWDGPVARRLADVVDLIGQTAT
jgi:putative hydrolase of the HAD superfamily